MTNASLKILIIGGGGREHALAWKIAQSPRVKELYVAPGNAGTAAIARNLDIPAGDMERLGKAAMSLGIDLTVVGPEAPLVAGIVDHFQSLNLPIFGPTGKAATIEGSKAFAKDLMQKYGIPCARSQTFSSYAEARSYVLQQEPPVVVKADGLAAGKGSIVAGSRDEAVRALEEIMERRVFGHAGDRVVIEECLEGKEVSLLAFTDGETVVPMLPACDYKRAMDGDRGLNTGGMGSFSFPPFFGPEKVELAVKTILLPTVRALAQEGRPFKGVLYAGLMLTKEGPRVMEFNARFGDPETQVILPLLETDLVEVLLAVVENRLDRLQVRWSDQACVGVVMASGGYPGQYATGYPVRGLDRVDKSLLVFHAGTGLKEGQVVTEGGRVLTVAAVGRNLAEARSKVYEHIPAISFKDCHYRKDIALLEAA